MEQVTVLGGYGFVGSHFWEQIKDQPGCVRNERNDYNVKTPNVINFISTIHNYNVFGDLQLDIETNLVTLMKTIQSWADTNHNHVYKDGTYNFISSWFVYGGNEGSNVKETDHC